MRILIVCTLCKTSYNVLINSHLCRGGEGGRWFIEFLGGGGVVKKRESPDFRSPEVGISELVHPFFLCCIFLYCIWLLLHIHKAINLKTKPDAL